MPAPANLPALNPDTLVTLGQAVELGQVARALKKLWENTSGAQTRASLVNFAVYGEGAASLEKNTLLISDFTREHACRAILIAHERSTGTPQVQAWVNAHCHVRTAGAKQVCCEQVTFYVQGGSNQLLANVLFANLDSDLPLILWWQGPVAEPADEQLWTWVDRLVFDSRDWADLRPQFAALQNGLKHAGSRLVLCDLNWTRTLHLRQALAQMFDHPENLAQLPRLTKLELAHAPGSRSTALLFAAWIAAQMNWQVEAKSAEGFTLSTPEGGRIAARLREAAGAPVSRCELSAGDASVVIQRDAGSRFCKAEVRLPDGSVYRHLLPAGGDELGGLLDEEVTLGGRHRVYLKALRTAEAMF